MPGPRRLAGLAGWLALFWVLASSSAGVRLERSAPATPDARTLPPALSAAASLAD